MKDYYGVMAIVLTLLVVQWIVGGPWAVLGTIIGSSVVPIVLFLVEWRACRRV